MHLESITTKELIRRYHKQMKIIMLWHLVVTLAIEEIEGHTEWF